MSTEPVVFRNGDYVSASRAAISLTDRGFLYGDAIFDALPISKGRVFKLDRRLARFFDSLKAASLETEMSVDDWGQAIVGTVRQNGLRDAVVGMFVTRGVATSDEATRRDPPTIPTALCWRRRMAPW